MIKTEFLNTTIQSDILPAADPAFLRNHPVQAGASSGACTSPVDEERGCGRIG
jgi:hypothetical protein